MAAYNGQSYDDGGGYDMWQYSEGTDYPDVFYIRLIISLCTEAAA
jgi:hypothetical protein